MDRSSYCYRAATRVSEQQLSARLIELSRQHPRFGYRRLAALLRREQLRANHKRVHRLYRQAGLMVRRRKPRRALVRSMAELPRLTAARQEWAADFLHDQVGGNQAIRLLTVVDQFTRAAEVAVATSFGARRVTEVLEAMACKQGGYPQRIRVDNGPEFTSRYFQSWCEQRGIAVVYIEPGKPMQNGYIESFNGKLRDECLDANCFANLAEARITVASWSEHYHHQRPHSSLGYLTPADFARQQMSASSARSAWPAHGSPAGALQCADPANSESAFSRPALQVSERRTGKMPITQNQTTHPLIAGGR